MNRKIFGCIFAAMFIITQLAFGDKFTDWRSVAVQGATIVEMALCLLCFIPYKKRVSKQEITEKKLSKRTIAAVLISIIAIPVTLAVGTFLLKDSRYYFISLLIILETFVPFMIIFEKRKPQARELVIISSLCAIAVAGRAAFYWLPQFKPVIAVVIISAVCFGAETGFLVGAVTGFVSNFFFGQGPWTPWQMFSFGLIGLVAGILFSKGLLKKSRIALSVFGAVATVVIYGGIMNPASVIMWQENPNAAMILSSYVMGLPFDLIHAMSTAFFLWFISEPMTEKLDRVKNKYGLIE